jgi:hypothetical protein
MKALLFFLAFSIFSVMALAEGNCEAFKSAVPSAASVDTDASATEDPQSEPIPLEKTFVEDGDTNRATKFHLDTETSPYGISASIDTPTDDITIVLKDKKTGTSSSFVGTYTSLGFMTAAAPMRVDEQDVVISVKCSK